MSIFSTKLMTLESAIAPFQKVILNLKDLITQLGAKISANTDAIESLVESNKLDVTEVAKAQRVLLKLENLFNDDEPPLDLNKDSTEVLEEAQS